MQKFIVYRDKLFVPSESFIANTYRNFQELLPVYVGMTCAGPVEDRNFLVLKDKFRHKIIEEALAKQAGWLRSDLLNELQQLEAGLVHAHFGKSGAFFLPFAEKLDLPLVVTFHGGDATKETHRRKSFLKVYNRRKKDLFEKAAMVIAVSGFIRDRLVEQGLSAGKVVVHHNGVDPDFFTAGRKRRKLLFVGRFVAKKGINTLIEALSRIKPVIEDWEIVLIGDGPLRPRVKEAISESGLSVKLIGWAERETVRDHMAESLIVVVPSNTAASGDSEGLPMVVMEAMMSSSAVIASRHSGIPEAVADGETGLLFDEGDADQLATRISTLVCDAAIAEAYGLAGRNVAETSFNILTQSARLEQMLKSC